jgi:hypothetical protein
LATCPNYQYTLKKIKDSKVKQVLSWGRYQRERGEIKERVNEGK